MPPRRRSKRIAAAAASSATFPPSEPSAASQFWGIDHLRRDVISILGIDKAERHHLLPLLTVNRQTFVDVVATLYRNFDLYDYPVWHHRVSIHRIHIYARAVKKLNVEGSLPFCIDIAGYEGLIHAFPNVSSIVSTNYIEFDLMEDGAWSIMGFVTLNIDAEGEVSFSPSDYHIPDHIELFPNPIIDLCSITEDVQQIFDRRVRLEQTQTLDFPPDLVHVISELVIDLDQSLETWAWLLQQPSFPSVMGCSIPCRSLTLPRLWQLSESLPHIDHLEVEVWASAEEAFHHFQWSKFAALERLDLTVVAGCPIKEPFINVPPKLRRLSLTFEVGVFNELDIRLPPSNLVPKILPDPKKLAATLHACGLGHQDNSYEIGLQPYVNRVKLYRVEKWYKGRVQQELETLVAETQSDTMVIDSE